VSTILKALRRLEHERRTQTPVDLREAVAGGAPVRRAQGTWVGVFLAGAGVALLSIAAWSAWTGRDAATTVAPPPARTAPGAVAARPPVKPPRDVEPARESAEVASPERAPAPAPLVADRPAPAPPPPAAKRSAPAPPPEVVPAPKVARAIPAPAPRPAAKPEPPAPRAAEPAPRKPAPPPPPAEEPAVKTVVRAVPPPVVRRTIWHPDADRRRAVVELEGRDEPLTLRQGDAVGGLVVVEIEPSAVTFLRDGVTLRRRVGQR
jgi:hypothetical protein